MATSLNSIGNDRLNPLQPGQFRFAYLEKIGEGGLGRVDRIRVILSSASSKPVGSEWACKRLNAKWSQHPVMRARFEREISALKRMSHRNIITYEGESLPGGERFYVMPRFATNLRTHIALGSTRGGWRNVAAHGVHLAEALSYAHGFGFVHRDFKPDNVLFSANTPLIIADWGLGYFVHMESQVLQHLTVGGMGTAYYCSAEQWATGKCDQRGDIYSLGMTLDEWVTGRQRAIAVGAGITSKTTLESTAAARQFNELLRWMTNSSTAQRPTSMSIVVDELHRIVTVG